MRTVLRIALGEFLPNVHPCAYKISKFRSQFYPMRITIHINMAILVEAPRTVYATTNETGALPATLPKVLHPTIPAKADIKGWNFDCKHSVCMTTALAGKPSPQCRLRAEEKGSDNVVDAGENRFCIDAKSGRSATLPEVQT